MSEPNEGMPFVPEEDLNEHENFQPIIAESGVIRSKEPILPEDLTVLPDTTFTRVDTVQDLVQIRRAEQEAANAKEAQEAAKQEGAKQEGVSAEQPTATPKEQPQIVQAQTVPTQEFAATPVPKKDQTPAKEKAPAKEKNSAKEKISTQPPLAHKNVIERRQAEQQKNAPEIPLLAQAEQTQLRKTKRKKRKEKRLTKQGELAQATPEQPAMAGAKSAAPETAQPAAEKSAAVPVQPADKPTEPATPGQPAPQPVKKHRWLWAVALVCFLFLGTIGGVIPVEKIPLLRNLAYAMGFTKDTIGNMSFLRALLTWTDKTVGLIEAHGTRPSWWARLWGEDAAPSQELGYLSGLQSPSQRDSSSRLFDINRLNELQRQRGLPEDQIRGSVMPIPGNETNRDPSAVIKDDNASAQTEANQQRPDVFFGSDANAVRGGAQYGYDSVNMFKKIGNPNIAGVSSNDWLLNTAYRMMKADAGISGVNQVLGGMHVNWGTDLTTIGEQKPHRDLYSAWITSRMANYTNNLMLKKALADTGFMGAEMPSMASNVVGLGGMQVDVVSLQEDQEAWRKYVEFEKQCKEAFNTSGKTIGDKITEFNNLVRPNGDWDFPQDCSVASTPYASSRFSKNISTIQTSCNEISQNYSELENKCHLVVKRNASNCQDVSTTYQGHWTGFQTWCYAQLWPEYKTYCANQQGSCMSFEQYKKENGGKFKEGGYIDTLGVNWRGNNKPTGDATMRDVVINELGGGSGYFPEDSPAESLQNYMGENGTI